MRYFLSYSVQDRAIVENVWTLLGPKAAWLDKVELDVGDLVLERIENAIRKSVNFVLFWSKSASNSEWVKLEIHMGFLNMLEQRGCKLRVIILDDTPLSLFLKVYEYLDVRNNLKNAPDNSSLS